MLARTIKDTFNRYKTMKGYQVKRKAGWDTHGLPVELGVEKELGITKADIDNKDSEKYISTEDYNKKCRENVMMFTQEWRELTHLRQQVYRDPVVAVAAVLSEGIALQGLHHSALFTSCRNRLELA